MGEKSRMRTFCCHNFPLSLSLSLTLSMTLKALMTAKALLFYPRVASLCRRIDSCFRLVGRTSNTGSPTAAGRSSAKKRMVVENSRFPRGRKVDSLRSRDNSVILPPGDSRLSKRNFTSASRSTRFRIATCGKFPLEESAPLNES